MQLLPSKGGIVVAWDVLGTFPLRTFSDDKCFLFFPFLTMFLFVNFPSHSPIGGGDFARLRLACFLQTPFACRSTDVSTSDPGVVVCVSRRKSVAELFVRSMLLPRLNHPTVCMSAVLPTESSNPRPLHYNAVHDVPRRQRRYLKKLSPRCQIHHSKILSSLHAHLSMPSLNCYILLLQKKT